MRMREQDQELDQEQAPFRVLSPGARILYEPRPVLRSPPPTRAPEPYKLAPQTPGCGRSQRKSSFAIIAEPQTYEPLSRPASGRLSPFRGRGFKGPPPRHNFSNGLYSPPDGTSQRTLRPRPVRPGSISQQNSPKRSLIPRVDPSHSGPPSKGASPRFGRRAAHRYTSSIATGDPNQRRPSQRELLGKKRAELQPISLAASRNKLTVNNKDTQKSPKKSSGIQRTARSEERLNKKSPMPSKNEPDVKRFITAKTPTSRHKSISTEALDSPSKIPLIRGPATGNLSTIDSQTKSPAAKPSATTIKNSINKPGNQTQNQSQSKKNDDAPKVSKPPISQMASGNNNSMPKEGTQSTVEDDLSLVDLLKQSSGATGTSSVVNTTTTTAVQPLKIDASSILPESELVAKLANLEKMQKGLEATGDSPDGHKSSNSKKSQEPETKATSAQNQQTAQTSANNTLAAKPERSENKVTELKEANSKNGNMTQTIIKHFGPNSIHEDKSLNNNSSNNNPGTDPTKATENVVKTAVEPEKSKEQSNKRPMEEEDKHVQTPGMPSNNLKSDGKPSLAKVTSKTTNSTNDAKKASPSPIANNVVPPVENTEEKTSQATRAKENKEATLKAQAEAPASESPGSMRSTDTGVSVNTVRGVSSAKEKTGLHLVKPTDEIETLSGNINHVDKNGEKSTPGETASGIGAAATLAGPGAATRWQKLKDRYCSRLCRKEGGKGAENWLGRCCCSGWSKMRCLACKRDPKPQLWPKKQAKAISTMQLNADHRDKPLTRWEKLKNACRCAKMSDSQWCCRRKRRRQQHRQVPPSMADLDKSCCPANRCFSTFCHRIFSACSCDPKKSKRTRTVKAKHSLTSVAAPPLSEETRPKIPDVLVEHNSLMRAAIPCLPVPVAWFCLLWNVLLPGSGTIFSGFFNICMGQPRFSAVASLKARFGALIVNFVVGVSQLFTVLFCLVGWGWSIWWGVTMIRLARKYKRFKDSEAIANDPEARAVPEAATLPAPGVPSQGLRGTERTH